MGSTREQGKEDSEGMTGSVYYITHTHTCTCIHKSTHTHVHMHIYTRAHAYTHAHAYIYLKYQNETYCYVLTSLLFPAPTSISPDTFNFNAQEIQHCLGSVCIYLCAQITPPCIHIILKLINSQK